MYEDVANQKIIGLSNFSLDNNMFMTAAVYDTADQYDEAAEILAASLLSSSSYNSSRSANWYQNSSYSDIEVIARMIYGENSNNTTDSNAIGWVILNRYAKKSSTFGLTLRNICGNKVQFNGVDSSNARSSKNPTDNVWKQATFIACLMSLTTDNTIFIQIVGKPTGISNQLYFRSASTLGSSKQIYESGGVLYAYYSSGSVKISNACIAGVGTATTVKDLKDYCYNNYGSLGYYNVFFYH